MLTKAEGHQAQFQCPIRELFGRFQVSERAFRETPFRGGKQGRFQDDRLDRERNFYADLLKSAVQGLDEFGTQVILGGEVERS
jgi:hypothetical protein